MVVEDVVALDGRCEVLIAGGGPAGLALATELVGAGVACVVVEPRTEPSVQPGAKLCNLRTMQFLRRWGLVDRVREAAELPAGFPTNVRFVTDLSGYELAVIPDALSTGGAAPDQIAEPAQQIAQYRLEQVFVEHLASSPLCTLVRGARVTEVVGDEAGVQVRLENAAGEVRDVRAGWLAGCDGARSIVRRAVGGSLTGRAPSAMNLAIVLDSDDVDVFDRFGPAVHYWTVGSVRGALFGPIDARRRWWMHLHGFSAGTTLAEIDVPGEVQRILGRPTDLDIVDVTTWMSHALVADRYRFGRVVLVGDAAHLHPPMGGYGMNMGIGDAVDVGWKLAAVVQGQAGPELLDSYEQERRPIHERTIAEAVGNYEQLAHFMADRTPLGPELRERGSRGDAARRDLGAAVVEVKAQEFASAGLQLGFRYSGSPLVSDEDGRADAGGWDVSGYRPEARPGCILPHHRLADGRALLDRLRGFTLLRCADTVLSRSGARVLAEAAAAVSMPLHLVDVVEPGVRAGLGADLVLVRPDTVVAWRGSGGEREVASVPARALGRTADVGAAPVS